MTCRQTLVKLIFFPSFPSVFKAEHLSLHSFSIFFRAGSVKNTNRTYSFLSNLFQVELLTPFIHNKTPEHLHIIINFLLSLSKYIHLNPSNQYDRL